jgi:anti-anti-sigma regulatory factor
MGTVTVFTIDEMSFVSAMQDAKRKLEGSEDEILLDFSGVLRIDSAGLRAMAELAQIAEEKAVRVAVQGVGISVYKTLKLMRLPRVFWFER